MTADADSKGNHREASRRTINSDVNIRGLKPGYDLFSSSKERKVSDGLNKQKLLAYSQGKRTFENSIMLENWKENNKHYINRNLRRAHKVQGRSTLGGPKVINRPAVNMKIVRHVSYVSRRSEVDRGMSIHGQSGAIKVHTGKNETRLVSENGNLNIFMENPDKEDHKDSDKPTWESSRRSPLSEEQSEVGIGRQIHVINPDELGLKKSYIAIKDANRSKAKKIGCNVPPCSTR